MAAPQQQYVDSLLQLITKKKLFEAKKDADIAQIKSLFFLKDSISEELRYQINVKIAKEYEVYMTDSAIGYVLQNKHIAKKLNNRQMMIDADLNLASLYVVTGMYYDALGLLQMYRSADLSAAQQIFYYKSWKSFYDNYKYTTQYTRKYNQIAEAYRDSLLEVIDESSLLYRLYYAEQILDNGDVAQSRLLLEQLLREESISIREKAMTCFFMARSYQLEGNLSETLTYYSLSAMHDIQGNIKENTAARALAMCLYEEGKIEPAYLCIRSSMEDAMFCNARLRTHEVATVLPIIDLAYRDKINKEKRQLKVLLIVTVILSICLIFAMLNVYKHMKKNSQIGAQLKESNDKLEVMNDSLKEAIEKLNQANNNLSNKNTDLTEGNRLKEMYIAQFLDLCSNYILKLERYQNMLNKKAAGRQLDDLYKILKSREMINDEVKELYRTFDDAFLHLYPSFVSDFNDLLLPEERFELVGGELNIEQRIFALIRLGITDSSRIAQFLHYSANTIYNYRTRVRNKSAVPRDEFEQEVMKIGV